MSLVQQQQYTPFIKPYVEGPTKEYKELQDRLIKDYDESAMMYDSLQEAADNMKYIKGSKGDEEAYRQIWQEASSKIEEAAKAGDYENRARQVRKAIKDFTGSYKPLAERYSSYNENIKNILENKDYGEEKKALAIKALQENYLNNPTYNERGKVNLPSWQTYMPFKDIDYYKKVVDIIDKVKADKWESLPGHANIDGYDALVSQSTSKRDPNKLYKFATAYLEHDPEIKSYFDTEKHLNKYKYDAKTKESILNSKDFADYASRYTVSASNPEEEARINETLFQNYIIDKRKMDTAKTAAEALGFQETSYDWKWSPQTELDLEYKKQMIKNKADLDYANANVVPSEGESLGVSFSTSKQMEKMNSYAQASGTQLASAGSLARRMGVDMKVLNTLNAIIDKNQLNNLSDDDKVLVYKEALNKWNSYNKNKINLTEEQLQSLPYINNERQAGLLNLNRYQSTKSNLQQIEKEVISKGYFPLQDNYNKFNSFLVSLTDKNQFKDVKNSSDYLELVKESSKKLEEQSKLLGQRFVHTDQQRLKALGIKTDNSGSYSKASYQLIRDIDNFNKGTNKFLSENKDFTVLGYVLQGTETSSVGKYTKLLGEVIDHAPEKLHSGGVDALNVIAEREGVKADDITDLKRVSKPELYGDSPVPSTSVKLSYKVNGKEKTGTFMFDVPNSQLEGHKQTLIDTYKQGNKTTKEIIARGVARQSLTDNAELTSFLDDKKPGKYEVITPTATWTIIRTSEGMMQMKSDNYSKNGINTVSIDLPMEASVDLVLNHIGRYIIEAQ